MSDNERRSVDGSVVVTIERTEQRKTGVVVWYKRQIGDVVTHGIASGDTVDEALEPLCKPVP